MLTLIILEKKQTTNFEKWPINKYIFCTTLYIENQCNQANLIDFLPTSWGNFSHNFHPSIRFRLNFTKRPISHLRQKMQFWPNSHAFKPKTWCSEALFLKKVARWRPLPQSKYKHNCNLKKLKNEKARLNLNCGAKTQQRKCKSRLSSSTFVKSAIRGLNKNKTCPEQVFWLKVKRPFLNRFCLVFGSLPDTI